MTRHHGPLSFLGIAVVVGVVVLDQAAKWLAEAYLPFGRVIDFLPFLSLYRTYNEGIAFSLLAGVGKAGLIAITAAISAGIVAIWARSRETGRMAGAAYALILGGALGNLIDRIAYGQVIDYLLLHRGDWTLFVFNLADAALTLGPVLLIASIVLPPKGTDPQK